MSEPRSAWPRPVPAGGRADAKKVPMAQALYSDKRHSIAEICQTLRVSRATLYRYI